MVKYNYSRYNAISSIQPPTPVECTNGHGSFTGSYKNAIWNATEKMYEPSGDTYSQSDIVPSGAIAWTFYSTYVFRAVSNGTYPAYAIDDLTQCKVYNGQYTTSYSRGTLIQSNIVAEDGTYPANGRYTDGYWYVRGTVANTAPAIPGAFTNPIGDLEIGDSRVISWGASSDAEGNLQRYILEASINGGSWAQIATPTTNSYTYTIPTATSIAFRVKARDTEGLESGYRTGNALTVTKPKYYWSKYNNSTYSYYYEGAWFEHGIQNGYYMDTAYKGYNFNSTNGTFTVSGQPWGIVNPPAGSTGYNADGRNLHRYVATGNDSRVTYYSKTSGMTTDNVRGSLVQSNIIGEENTYPNNVRHSDGYWYIRGSRVNASIAPPGAFTAPAPGRVLEPKQSLTLTFSASSAPSISTYEVDYRYNGGSWATVGAYANSLSRAFTVTEDKSLTTVEFRVRAKNTSNVYSDYVYSEAFTIQHNKAPTLSLNMDDSQTLYENDTLTISGTAIDTDIGNVVSVKYRINDGNARTIDAKVMDGTSLVFDRVLTFKQGILYDGSTAVSGKLEEGKSNTVTVWAEDDQGGKSADAKRTFFVVANRPPVLTLNPNTDKSNLIPGDVITISGSVTDPEGDNVKVSYKLNDAAAVKIYEGESGNWAFDVLLKDMKTGKNTVAIEAEDSYGAKTTKTLQLTNTFHATALKKATAMWRINSASTTTKEVLAWIQRVIGDLAIEAEISMTNAGEQENFVPMDLTNSAPVGDVVIEDEFDYLSAEGKENIILKLTLSREDTASQDAIKLISGVLE